MKITIIKIRKDVTYIIKDFVTMKMKNRILNYTKKLEIIITGKPRGAARSICNLRYKVPHEIPVKIHNGSKYDYHFIIKELAEEFKGQFECLGEKSEKYISFSVPIIKEHNDGINKMIPYKLKFIDICRFTRSKYQILLITCLK